MTSEQCEEFSLPLIYRAAFFLNSAIKRFFAAVLACMMRGAIGDERGKGLPTNSRNRTCGKRETFEVAHERDWWPALRHSEVTSERYGNFLTHVRAR